ncbi:hypothetical protein B0H14DRAFT_2564689 [Mycena olivaceomarginata]|nr:hypothetical protein B0H14DRAFT_2564689 [Mycena olivaceomarginata]
MRALQLSLALAFFTSSCDALPITTTNFAAPSVAAFFAVLVVLFLLLVLVKRVYVRKSRRMIQSSCFPAWIASGTAAEPRAVGWGSSDGWSSCTKAARLSNLMYSPMANTVAESIYMRHPVNSDAPGLASSREAMKIFPYALYIVQAFVQRYGASSGLLAP